MNDPLITTAHQMEPGYLFHRVFRQPVVPLPLGARSDRSVTCLGVIMTNNNTQVLASTVNDSPVSWRVVLQGVFTVAQKQILAVCLSHLLLLWFNR